MYLYTLKKCKTVLCFVALVNMFVNNFYSCNWSTVLGLDTDSVFISNLEMWTRVFEQTGVACFIIQRKAFMKYEKLCVILMQWTWTRQARWVLTVEWIPVVFKQLHTLVDYLTQ